MIRSYCRAGAGILGNHDFLLASLEVTVRRTFGSFRDGVRGGRERNVTNSVPAAVQAQGIHVCLPAMDWWRADKHDKSRDTTNATPQAASEACLFYSMTFTSDGHFIDMIILCIFANTRFQKFGVKGQSRLDDALHDVSPPEQDHTTNRQIRLTTTKLKAT